MRRYTSPETAAIKTCDTISADLLSSTIGARLESVAARRYPGMAGYDQAILYFAEIPAIRVDLKSETVGPKFEVFSLQIRQVEAISDSRSWDRIHLSDFCIAGVFLLRREEWQEGPTHRNEKTIGDHGVEQRIGPVGSKPERCQGVLVDSGVSFLSETGAEISFYADIFPLVFQLRFESPPMSIPQGERVTISSRSIK